MVCILGFIIYLQAVGNTLTERALMNVGYGMIAVILVNFLVTLISLLIVSIGSVCKFCKKKRKRAVVEVD